MTGPNSSQPDRPAGQAISRAALAEIDTPAATRNTRDDLVADVLPSTEVLTVVRPISAFAGCLLLLAGAPTLAKVGCPKGGVSGTWNGTATDGRGVAWGWTMVVKQRGTRLSGRLEWRGSDGSNSTERVAGSIDCATRGYVLRGRRLTRKRGHASKATYRGEIGEDWRRISGAWSEGNAGTLTGSKQ